MSNRIPKRCRIGSFIHKKVYTSYKWYKPDRRAPNALEGMPLRLYPLQPEDQAHLDSIKAEK